MPRNASGVYSQPASNVNPPVAGTVIDPIAFANALIDIATELTNSLDRQGRGAMQAALAMGGFKITGMGAAVAVTDGARLGDVQSYLPPGTIIMHGAVTAPAGWLACDGSAFSRIGATAALFAVIGTTWGVGDGSTTANLPDFRGYFPRGYDNGAGIDPARVFASLQADGFKAHTHVQNAHNHGITDPGHSHTVPFAISGSAASAGGLFTMTSSPTSTSSVGTGVTVQNATAVNQSTGGTETVPKNKACLFIIRT